MHDARSGSAHYAPGCHVGRQEYRWRAGAGIFSHGQKALSYLQRQPQARPAVGQPSDRRAAADEHVHREESGGQQHLSRVRG